MFFVANEGLWFSSRQQVTEIIFVLKAISTLMDSLKKTQPENGEYQTVKDYVDLGEKETQ